MIRTTCPEITEKFDNFVDGWREWVKDKSMENLNSNLKGVYFEPGYLKSLF